MDQPFLYLSREVVRQNVSMVEAIALMKDAFGLLSAGEAHLPVRQNLGVPEVSGEFLMMPVCATKLGHFGIKTVGIHRENASKKLPLIHAMVLLFNAQTGQPQALMDGEWLTALRTGAASGLATDLLAKKDAGVAAVVGAGVQARSQLEAVIEVRDLHKIWVWNRNRDRAQKFANEMHQSFGITVALASSPEDLREAEIICTATSASTPLFSDAHVSPGTHINAVGAYRSDMHEVPVETVAKATVVVDQREAALREAGDLLIPIQQGLIDESHIKAELGEWVHLPSGGRTSDEEITLFKSVGNAIQDLAVAACAYKNALARGHGQVLPL